MPQSGSTLGLVILDCDGVLVDSERITTTLLAELITNAGWPMDGDEATRRFKGHDLHEVQKEVEARVGRALGEGWLPDYRVRMAKRFDEQGVPPINGAAELLDWLDGRQIPHAVASNGPPEKMRLTLGRIGNGSAHPDGWFGRFDGRCFSAYEIGKWKPEPDLFLHAAEKMGHAPERCVVVEDSVSGVRAAAAAGMRTVALADLTSPEVLVEAGATEVRPSLAGVMALLASWVD